MIKAIIIDIEGTTSSLSFVKDVLFPYARAKLPAFVEAHQQDAQLQVLLDDAAKIMGGEPDIQTLITQFVNWIDEDKKITPLKSLQGLIWEAGYQQGDFKGLCMQMQLRLYGHGKPKDWRYMCILRVRCRPRNCCLPIPNTAI